MRGEWTKVTTTMLNPLHWCTHLLLNKELAFMTFCHGYRWQKKQDFSTSPFILP